MSARTRGGGHAAIRRPVSGEPRRCPDCGRLLWKDYSCKRRDCPGYVALWLGDARVRILENVMSYGGDVAMLTLTAPGADELPWDTAYCEDRGPHKCSGKLGCRVNRGVALGFNRTSDWRYSQMHRVAYQRCYRRYGAGALRRLAIVPELQARGVVHWHIVVGVATPRERAAAELYRDSLEELAPLYWWGYVGRKLKPAPAAPAAFYVSKYMVKGEGSPVGVEHLLVSRQAPRTLVSVCRRQQAVTGCTARILRFRRQVFAHNGMHYDCVTLASWRRMLDEHGTGLLVVPGSYGRSRAP